MNSTWLYGVEVRSPSPLFATPTPETAAAPGAHAPIALVCADTDACSGSPLAEKLSFELTHGRMLTLSTDRPLGDSVPGQPWRLEVAEVVTFCWRGWDDRVEYQLLVKGTEELASFWFAHIVLPLHLTLERGFDFMHAAAVEVNGAPILFIAPSTGGKSTLADYFLQRGHALLSDDKVATFRYNDQYWAAPSHPHHRPWREFEVLGSPVQNFARQAGPIKAIYSLCGAAPDVLVSIDEVLGFRKFEELLPNYLFSFDYLRARRLAWLGRMAESLPVFRVQHPWDLDRLSETYRAISLHASGC